MFFGNLEAIVLAAGKSNRFKTDTNKLLEKICGKEMILFSTKLLENMGIKTTLVVGNQKELIKKVVKEHHKNKINFIQQKEQLGTGHAVACTKSNWEKSHILILNGDMPLITKETIENLFAEQIKHEHAFGFVTAHYENPNNAYGRVVSDKNGLKIVEARDFKKEKCDYQGIINAGIYIVRKDFLEKCIEKIEKSSTTNEFYITSLAEIASKENVGITTVNEAFEKVIGVNTLGELLSAEKIKRSELIQHWMNHGVRFCDTQNTYVDVDTQIGAGTAIGHGVHLIGKTNIGKNCKVRQFSTIENSILEDSVEILPNCLVRDSHICQETQIGPFAHIHSQTKIEKDSIIGNFIEIKQSKIGKYTHAKHHAYLGNSTIGSRVNIGAGTVICNHDGIAKHQTTIEDNAYIGSNSTLVAPVKIEQNAFTAAGSTITENVPKNCLAIGRSKQTNKEDYVQKLLEKLKLRSLKINANNKKESTYICATKENENKQCI